MFYTLHAAVSTHFFFLSGFSFTNIHESQDCREGGGHFFNSSLPLPSASQTLRHQPGDYCRELTSAHSQQPGSNQEPLVSEWKSLTTKLRWSGHSFVIKFLKVSLIILILIFLFLNFPTSKCSQYVLKGTLMQI